MQNSKQLQFKQTCKLESFSKLYQNAHELFKATTCNLQAHCFTFVAHIVFHFHALQACRFCQTS
jgi:hypothetical protein